MLSQEYGSQDFFGVIDELRIWGTVRKEDEIKQVRAPEQLFYMAPSPLRAHRTACSEGHRLRPCSSCCSAWRLRTLVPCWTLMLRPRR